MNSTSDAETVIWDVTRVTCRRDGNGIAGIDLFFPPETTEAAYQRMTRLGTEWDIDTHRIDSWFTRRMAQRAQGGENQLDTAFTSELDTVPLGDGDGPVPSIEVSSSFDESHPVVVNLSFTWQTGTMR